MTEQVSARPSAVQMPQTSGPYRTRASSYPAHLRTAGLVRAGSSS
ncbi:hypothetical protein [Streptomyces zaomyceticus]